MKSYRRVILPNSTPPAQPYPANPQGSASASAPAIAPPPASPSAPKVTQSVARQPNQPQPSPQSISKALVPQQNQIQGRVIYVGPLEHQPKNFDWALFLVLFPLLLLGLPLLIGLFAAVAVGSIALRLSGIRRRSSGFTQSLFQSVLLASLFRRGPAATEPVRSIRIRDKLLQQEVSVTIRGHLSSGDILEDDDVTIWGSWENGNFLLARGINQRTGSHIKLRITQSKILFWIAICILAVIVLLFLSASAGLGK